MKHLLFTTIAAVVLVGCGGSQSDISIHQAVYDGNIKVVKQHLDAGTDVNAMSAGGMTPLDLATHPGNPNKNKTEIANLLRKHGGKRGAVNSIHVAAKVDIEAVKQHLAAGADVNAKNKHGGTPLHEAAWYGRAEIAELLIAKGADVNAKDEDGYTSLHSAVNYGHKEIAELLIAEGADVNAKDEDGQTPLHSVTTKELIELLIDKGADVNAKNVDGQTPFDWFINTEFADLLRKHGGKTGAELKAEATK